MATPLESTMRSTLVRLLVVAVVSIALVAMAAAAGIAASSDPFTGAWTGQDPPPDNSRSLYLIGAPGLNGQRSITIFDPYASYCETNGQGTGAPFLGYGTGSNNATTTFAFRLDWYVCANGYRNPFDVTTIDIALTASNGTISDGIVTFHRIGR